MNVPSYSQLSKRCDRSPLNHSLDVRLIDTISVSLNSAGIKNYSELMRVDENIYPEMLDFTKKQKGRAECRFVRNWNPRC